MRTISINFILSGFFLLLSLNLQSQIQSGVELEKIIAWVDDEIVLKSELEITIAQFKGAYNLDTSEDIDCDVLETLILNKTMIAKSKIDSVYVDKDIVEQELNRRIQQMFAQFGGDATMVLKQYGKTLEELKNEIRPTLEDQMLIQQMQQKITGGITITPKEVKQFYKKIDKDSLPKFSTQVEVGHIVRYPKPSDAALEETSRKLEAIKKRIENGEDFGALAKEFSQDPGSAKFGGELGFFKRGQLVPEYEAAALSMRPGELSQIVQSQFGFHLIQLIERRGNEFNSKHILLKPQSNYKDIERERNFLDSIRLLILKDSLDFTVAAFKFNEDEVTKQSNGFLTDYEGNYKITVEKLGAVYFTIEDMQPGQISKPQSYIDDMDKQGTRIIYLKSRTLPHLANLSDDYQELREAALAEKKNSAIEEWFKTTKNQIYVQVDEKYSNCKIGEK